MNINDIPSELLLHIFSYLPQRDLFITTDQVCQYWRQLCLSPPLWKHVKYSAIRGDFSHPFEQLLQMQSYVTKLTITADYIDNLFGFQRKLTFLNLKTLGVSDRFVASEDFFDKIIQRCPNLENIKIQAGSNMEHGLSKLSDLDLLTIDIGHFHGTRTLDENIILLLKKQPRLKKLALHGWNNNTGSNIIISDILDYFPNISSLYLSALNTSSVALTRSDIILNLTELTLRSTSIDDEGIQHIIKRAKQLKVLNIELCENMTDKTLYCVSQNCPLLEELSFGHSSGLNVDNFTNSGLFSIAERSLNLKYLSILPNKNIDDDGVISLVKSCHGLTYIALNRCTKMTDISLIAIGEHCPLLREANFSNCFNISARGVYCLIRSCRGLNKLILSYCTGISDDNIDDVNENEQDEAKNQQTEIRDQQTEAKYQQTEMKDQQTEAKDEQTEMKAQQTEAKDRDIETEDHQTEMKDQQTEMKHEQLISNFAIHSHLKELYLGSCRNISKKTVLRFTDICPDLRKINLSSMRVNNSEDDDFIVRIFDDCKFVTEFDVFQRKVHRKNYNQQS